MYKILKCSEVTDSEIYTAFNAGFIDYMIPIKLEVENIILMGSSRL